MKVNEVKNLIKSEKLVPILRTPYVEYLFDIVKAAIDAGGRIIEFTMSIPDIISKLAEIKEKFPDMVIGLGTVYEPDDACKAIERGADFIVTPILNQDLVDVVKSKEKLLILSGFTPTEIYNAYKLGSDLIKLFPASEVSPTFLREIFNPMPFVEIFPTGGLNLISAIQFISYGAVAVGMGASTIFKKELIKEKNFSEISYHLYNARRRIQNMVI
ncbi:MAG: bifunctional 4-hydroxy-2-oxoglutarate aldolase/2-dehydro-3-deoxy-phosphogluconate aldolase [Brevinematia bacterium]